MRLVVISGNQVGQLFEITRDVIVIGRDMQCDAPIADIAASRKHCQIRREPMGYVIQDLGSMNGTHVNGQRLSGLRPLQVGDVISIGKTELRLEDSPSVPAYLPPSMPSYSSPMMSPVMDSPMVEKKSNIGIWIALGGGLIVLLLLGIVVAIVILLQPIAPEMPTAVAVAPIVATPNAPTVLVPSDTPMIAPSATALAPTRVPTAPGAAATTIVPAPGNIESTRTPTPTPTNTPTRTPTATPTRQFAAPVLLKPQDKGKYSSNDLLVLQWYPLGNLREKDQYYLQVSTRGEFQNDLVCTVYTQNTQVTLSGEVCAGGLQFNARYFWRVGMVAPDANGKPTPISPFSGIWEFGWQP
jgi:hypothetical protein